MMLRGNIMVICVFMLVRIRFVSMSMLMVVLVSVRCEG